MSSPDASTTITNKIIESIFKHIEERGFKIDPDQPELVAKVPDLNDASEDLRRKLLFLPMSPQLNADADKRNHAVIRLIKPWEIEDSSLRLAVANELCGVRASETNESMWKYLEHVFALEFRAYLKGGGTNSDVLRSTDSLERAEFYLHRVDLSEMDLFRIHLALRSDLLGSTTRAIDHLRGLFKALF